MDLELVLSSGSQPDVYEVDVSSSAGHATGELRLDVDGLLARRPQLQSTVLASAVSARRTLSTTEVPVRRVGEELFAALFTGAVYGRYMASIATARARGEALRLVLHVRAPELAAVPWETLFDPEAGEYLCQSEPLVRHVDVAAPIAPLTVQPPLRVLGVVAAPSDLAPLDTEAEQERLTGALHDAIVRGDIELVWAPGGRWFDVQTALLDGPWHIVHFIGHGGYDDRHREGVLALVGARDESDMVGAERFTRLLRTASPSPRLVVLNSCSSGAAASDDLFSSTAASLVRSGIPAAVAMQFTVSDAAATVFAGGFYSAIAHNRSVGEAVRVGRIAIDGISPNTLEWVTPVVYLRGEDGPLFTVATGDHVAQHRGFGGATVDAPDEGARSDHLDSLYVQALAELRLGHDDDALAYFDSIVALDADYRDAASRRDDLRQARRAAEAYAEARAAEIDGCPDAAARSYEAALEIDPDFRDARERADACRRQQRIDDLVSEMRVHAEAGDDRAVISTAAELAELDPDLADPDGLATVARRHLVEQELEEQYAARYDEAREAEIDGDWERAIAAYGALIVDRPDYRDTMVRVAACRDQERIEELHGRVRRLSTDGHWDEVVMLGGDLADIDPAAADPDGLVTAARERLAERERIDALCIERFGEGRRAETDGDWQAAIAAYETIVDVRPEYRDTRDRLATCRQRFDDETAQREAERQRAEERVASALDSGVAHQASGDWERAIEAFDEVLEVQPDHVDAIRRRAACRRRLERERARAAERIHTLPAGEPAGEPTQPVDVAGPTVGDEASRAGFTKRRLVGGGVVAVLLFLAGGLVSLTLRGGEDSWTPDWGDQFLDAGLRRPTDVAVDGGGGLYVTDENRVWAFDAVAGHWFTGSDHEPGGGDGDGERFEQASFGLPFGIAWHDDTIYVGDTENMRLRTIDVDGLVATVAGNGEDGFGDDGVPAVDTAISFPYGVTVDETGAVYFADPFKNRIRKVDTDGIITTVAGNSQRAYRGDGSAATEASLSSPYDVAVDGDGTVFIADTHNHRIRMVDTDGIITTIAGNGEIDYRGDGGAATRASVDTPRGVAVDDAGNVYIADTYNHTIRKVDTEGIITTIAGTGVSGPAASGLPAVEATLHNPSSVAFDRGRIYIADTENDRIRMIDADGIITTIVH